MFGRFFDRFKPKAPAPPPERPAALRPPEPRHVSPADCAWRPDTAQAGRIAALLGRMEAILPGTWRFAEHTQNHTRQYEPWAVAAHFDRPPLSAYYESTIAQLTRVSPDAVLRQAMADVVCFPAAWHALRNPPFPVWTRLNLTVQIGYRWLLDYPDGYAIDLLVRRTKYIVEHARLAPAATGTAATGSP